MRPVLLYLVVSPLTPRHLLCTTCTPPPPDFPHFQPALFSLESFPLFKIDKNLRRTEIDRGVLIRDISVPQGGWSPFRKVGGGAPFALATPSLSSSAGERAVRTGLEAIARTRRDATAVPRGLESDRNRTRIGPSSYFNSNG